MAEHKALLIGVDQYGDGFAPLPAATRDVACMAQALQAAGYETLVCPPEATLSTMALDDAIRGFCTSGGPDDVRIVYFSGHGLRADGVDWIVPRGIARHAAEVSPAQRLSTDLSATVAASAVGLVLFIIDACRDGADNTVTKGGGWGDSSRLARPAEARFVRYFGCKANEICQVVAGGSDAPSLSLFTKAVADSLGAGAGPSLAALRAAVERRCDELVRERPLLQSQTPHLNIGEISSATQAVLERPIFQSRAAEPTRHGAGAAAVEGLWVGFRPECLHCVVVLSEHAGEHAAEWGLRNLLNESLSGAAGRMLWQAFRAARHGQRLVDGRSRELAVAFVPAHVRLAFVPVLDAVASADALDHTVRALAQADLAVFDVTGFEPAVLLLAGIRAASRRGVSICSHGAGWIEGAPIDIPFNLQELNLNSHTPLNARAGDDPVVQRFVHRVEMGFGQMSRQPGYHDLPGYDALRRLGADYAASSLIGIEDQVLVLCSFERSFHGNWRWVRQQLSKALDRRGVAARHIERIIDYGSTQLVLQSLFEQLRRTEACVIDWSGFRASVFMEMGARLAVSEWGAVQIVDERYLPGGAQALAETASDSRKQLRQRQVECLRTLFAPLVYRRLDGRGLELDDAAEFDAVAAALTRDRKVLKDPDAAGYNRVYKAVQESIAAVQDALAPVALDLKRRADALHHPMQGQAGAPQVLYSSNDLVKQNAERTALELRLAAWLYLEHRVGSAGRRADPHLAELHEELGRVAVDGLYDLGDDASIELAERIEAQLGEEKAEER